VITVADLVGRGRETAALAAGGRSMGRVSVIVSVPVARPDSSLPVSAADPWLGWLLARPGRERPDLAKMQFGML